MTYDLDMLDMELRKTEIGRQVVAIFNRHIDEVFFLVSHHRQVMVAWQRNQGPAFISAFLESGAAEGRPIPKEINGVTHTALIRRMTAALQEAGSPELRKAVGDHAGLVMEWVSDCDSIEMLLNKLRLGQVLPPEPSHA